MIQMRRRKLSEVIDPNDEIAIIAGAGISINSPSNVPTARKIVQTLIEHIIPLEFRVKVQRIDRIRFEQFLDELQSTIDPELELLNFLEHVIAPNLIHYFIAELLLRDQLVLTTNFDYLIEIALKELNPKLDKVQLIITPDDYDKLYDLNQKKSSEKACLFKLHGSKNNFYTKENTGNSLITTMNALGKSITQDHQFGIDLRKKEVITPILNGRVVIVMGYSGSDDFDITPLLFELNTNKKLLWITHDPEKKIRISEIKKNVVEPTFNSKNLRQNATTDDLLQNLANQVDYPIHKIEGPTGQIVKKLWSLLLKGQKILKNEGSEEALPFNFSNWVRTLYEDVSLLQKYAFAFNLLSQFGDYESAFEIAEKGLLSARDIGDQDLQAEFLVKVGDVYEVRFEYDDALKQYFNAIEIVEKTDNHRFLAGIYTKIGGCFYHNSENSEALKYILKSRELNQKINNEWGEMNDLNYLGILASASGEWDKALNYYSLALRISEKLGCLYNRSKSLANIGRIYYNREDYDACLPFYRNALKISELLGILTDHFQDLDNIGMTLYKRNEWSTALPYFQKALTIAETIGEDDPAYIYYDQSKTHLLTYIAECYEQLGDFLLAYDTFYEILVIDHSYRDVKSIEYDYNKFKELFKKITRHGNSKVVKKIKRRIKQSEMREIKKFLLELWSNASKISMIKF
jgi:tetratricopeptide (TPR) repeat protein